MQAIIVALASSAVSFAVLYLLVDRRIRRRVDPETILAQIRGEIEGLILELNQTADRNLTLLEEKMGAVKDVLEQAERRVAVLKREARAVDQAAHAYAALREDPLPTEDGAAPPRGAGKRATGRARGRRAAIPPATPTPAEDAAEVRARIVSLHRAGISAESIVSRLKVPRATVELIVSLEEGREPPAPDPARAGSLP